MPFKSLLFLLTGSQRPAPKAPVPTAMHLSPTSHDWRELQPIAPQRQQTRATLRNATAGTTAAAIAATSAPALNTKESLNATTVDRKTAHSDLEDLEDLEVHAGRNKPKINPATGLPMCGHIDVGGNHYGLNNSISEMSSAMNNPLDDMSLGMDDPFGDMSSGMDDPFGDMSSGMDDPFGDMSSGMDDPFGSMHHDPFS